MTNSVASQIYPIGSNGQRLYPETNNTSTEVLTPAATITALHGYPTAILSPGVVCPVIDTGVGLPGLYIWDGESWEALPGQSSDTVLIPIVSSDPAKWTAAAGFYAVTANTGYCIGTFTSLIASNTTAFGVQSAPFDFSGDFPVITTISSTKAVAILHATGSAMSVPGATFGVGDKVSVNFAFNF